MSRSRQRRVRAPAVRLRIADVSLTSCVLATLLVACVFGGAPIGQGPAVIAFWGAGLATLVVAVSRGALREPLGVAAWTFVALACLLPFVQSVPLPYGVWTALPGHDVARGTFDVAGLAGGMLPWSVTPVDTLLCCLLVFPLAGVFLAVLRLGDDDVDILFVAIAAMILAGLAAGIVQVATAGAGLRFYERADHRYLLGFFSNKNHSATLLAAAMFVLTYFVRRLALAEVPRWTVVGGGIALLLAAILATNSRAGLALGCLAALLCAGSMVAHRAARSRWILLAVPAVAAIAIGVFSFSGIAERSVKRYDEVGSDRRWTIWTDTLVAIRDYAPTGSGMGSFVPVYRSVEPLASVNPRYANHAHNDYLELALEGGLPALALVALFVGLWGVHGFRLLARAGSQAPARVAAPSRRRPPPEPLVDRRTAQALVGSGMILLILLHSTIDYPLRTMTWSTLTAMSLALLMRARPGMRA